MLENLTIILLYIQKMRVIMKAIKIELQREGYLPGEIVEGTVNLTIDKPVKARAVKLDVTGLEETRITVSHGKSSTTYREHNYILRDEIILHGPQFEKNLELEQGNYVFKFEFKIPENAPPSYSGRHAFVTYKLIARVDVPLWLDIVDLKIIYVFRSREALKLLTQPVYFQSDNYSQLHDDKPGFSIELPKTGYRAGEHIECAITLKNMQASKIRKIDVTLLGEEFARARGHTRSTTQYKHEIEIPVHDMIEGVPKVCFLPIPTELPSSYEGMYSNFRWAVEVGLDIPFGFDVKALHPIEIIR